MECLVDSVAPYYGCGAPTPISGMYLSNLPGIEFANINDIANADQITWAGVWADVQATTKNAFRQDVVSEFGKRNLIKQTTQNVDLGKGIKTDSQLLTPNVGSTISNGLILETMVEGNQCIGSNLMTLYVQEVNFYWSGVNVTPNFTLNFQDADTKAITQTIVVPNAVQGWNNVFVDKFFTARRLQILASGNFDNYVSQDISNFQLDNFGGASYGYSSPYNYLFFNWTGCGIQSRVNGVQYNSANNALMRSQNIAGLSCIFSTKCSWDGVVCAQKRQFFVAWQHCLAINLLNYRINSSRQNRWTSIDKNQARELQALFTTMYRGGELYGVKYPGILRQTIESLQINDVDGCIKTNDYMMFTEARL